MIIIECKQGSEEWHKERAGVITASMFGLVRAKVGLLNAQQQAYVDTLLATGDKAKALAAGGYKSAPTSESVQRALCGEKLGEWSEAAKNYAFRLACERISGEPLDDQFETFAMRRGRELEEDCRLRHEADIKQIVDIAGFIKTDDGKFGCSADALVGDDGGGEYKCFYAADKVRPILIDDDWGDIKDQVQGCLWIAGRKWWDECLYFPALKSIGKDFKRARTGRDEGFIEQMEIDLLEFDALVCEQINKIRGAQ